MRARELKRWLAEARRLTPAQQEQAAETLKALSVVRREMGLQTVLGVSNISFGLPGRDAVNSTFFSMAMAAGLSCGIINPQSKPMMDAYYGFRALAGYDEGCKEYVQHYADAPKAAATTVSEIMLSNP